MPATERIDNSQKDIAAIESKVDRVQVVKCPKEQARTENQHHQQRYLDYDQSSTPTATPRAIPARRAALQPACEVNVRAPESRHQPEEHHGENRTCCRE